MPDMIVPLHRLPPRPDEAALRAQGVALRRAYPFELTPVREFIQSHFSVGWADEASVAFSRQPVTCLLALRDSQLVGFAVYESTRRGFFGPTGVAPEHRGSGIGKALLLASLWGLFDMGYAYGIIGAAGPVDFYAKLCGAVAIPDTEPGAFPGVYADRIGKSS